MSGFFWTEVESGSVGTRPAAAAPCTRTVPASDSGVKRKPSSRNWMWPEATCLFRGPLKFGKAHIYLTNLLAFPEVDKLGVGGGAGGYSRKRSAQDKLNPSTRPYSGVILDATGEVTKEGAVSVIGGGDTATACKKYDTVDKAPPCLGDPGSSFVGLVERETKRRTNRFLKCPKKTKTRKRKRSQGPYCGGEGSDFKEQQSEYETESERICGPS